MPTSRFLRRPPKPDASSAQQITNAQNALNRRKLIASTSAATVGVAIGHTSRSEPSAAQDEPPIQRPHAVVTAHSLATEAGMEMLSRNGTAADAAVAIAAALSVVEGWFSNVLGGEVWGLYFDAASAELTALDGVGPVGINVDVADYESKADQPGAHQSILPGSWDGWMLWLDRYGRLDLGIVLGPAIRIAREGFPASALMIDWLKRLEEDVRASPEASRTYLPQGEMPTTRRHITIPDLATTFERLAESYATSSGPTRSDAIQAARDYFYRGPLGEEVVDWTASNGGYLSLDDFSGYQAQIVPPISIDYSDEVTVYQCPPNSQGITMLLGLNILKGIDFSGSNIEDPEVLHLQIEALKLAFADRFAFIGDPARVEIPLEDLLSDTYAENQRSRIDLMKAMEWPIESGLPRPNLSNTSTFHIIDADGNIAGATTSIGAQFMIAGNTGIHMNARMPFLSLDPQEPNYMTPGFKVRHTSCPYMVFRSGQPWITGGNTGVDSQAQAQMQQFISMIDFGLSPQRAIDRPRFVSTSFPATVYPYDVLNVLQLEGGFGDDVAAALEERGHVVGEEGIVGTAAILRIEDDGATIEVGAESRLDTASGQVARPGE